MRKIALIAAIATTALIGVATPALAGPGCSDKPGVCPPADPSYPGEPGDSGNILTLTAAL